MADESIDIEEIFNTACGKQGPDERAAYLDEACRGRPEVRRCVEALLRVYYKDKGIADAPPANTGITFDDSPLTEGPGTKIGRYKLLQQIGEGGFGVVYMAEQQKPIRRRVALKIIKLGMDTKQVIARFEAERQALALMDHPNIARVFDAGATDTGRPYFVMELVKGVPITKYCDTNNLSTDERLRLFIDVCKAVQHAHQKGIIHRDIKPSNVMITLRDGVPVPKVIDFGIAKATQARLTEKTLFTEFRQFIGTPEYMSPEQAEMSELDVDTRSDIYSLGVLLYELLTGTTPFDAEELRSAAFDEIVRIIRETEPPKPSTRLNTLGETLTDIARHRHAEPGQLCKIVRGDLDWIVMKTLEKDRTRRYETSHGLVMDIERFLNDEPVTAGPPGTVYRIRKFVRRNRTAVGSVLLITAALVVGLVLATVGFVQASRQRDLAEERRQRAEIGFQTSFAAVEEMLKVAGVRVGLANRQWQVDRKLLADNPEVQELLQKLLREAQVLYKEFSEENRSDPAARLEMALAYDRLGEIHGLFSQHEQAEQAYRRAINIYQELIDEFPEEREYQHGLGLSIEHIGHLLRGTGRIQEANKTFQRGILFWSKLIGIAPETPYYRALRGNCYRAFGELEKAVADYTKLIELEPERSDHREFLGGCYLELGESEKALAEYTRAIELRPEDSRYWHMRGAAYLNLGEPEKGVADYTKAIEFNPEDSHYWHMRGLCYLELNKPEKAIAEYTRAIELDPHNAHYFKMLRDCCLKLGEPEKVIAEYTKAISPVDTPQKMVKLGQMLKETGQTKKAEELYRKALETQEKLTTESPEEAEHWAALGQLNLELKMWDEMAANYSKAIEINPQKSWYWHERGYANIQLKKWEEVVKDYSKVISFDHRNVGIWQRRGSAHVELGQYEKAIADLSEAIELRPDDAHSWNLLAECHRKRGEPERAVAEITKLIESDPNSATYWNIRGGLYSNLGQPEKAIADYTKAIEFDTRQWWYRQARGGCYFNLGEWEKAATDFTKAIELHPDNWWRSWYMRGACYFELGEFEKAAADYTKALELKPDAWQAWDRRFKAYMQLGQQDRALADITKLIEWSPDNADYRHMRGGFYLELGEFEKAIADYTKAIELKPGAWDTWEKRFEAYMQLGQPEKALADYSSLIELKPQDARVRVSRGDCYLNHLKNYHKALEDYSVAVELDPNFPEAWYSRGLAYVALGQYEKAAFDFTKAVELGWNGAHNLYCQALAESGSGDAGKYRKTCATMLERFGGTGKPAEIHWVVWTCVLAPDSLEDLSQAVKLAEWLLSGDEKNEQYVRTLGAALYRSGRFEESAGVLGEMAAAWENGKKLPTNFSPAYAWFFLAMAHYQSGNVDESLKYFAKSQEQAEEEIAGSAAWNRRLTLELLGAEAAELLGVTEEPVEKEVEPEEQENE